MLLTLGINSGLCDLGSQGVGCDKLQFTPGINMHLLCSLAVVF